MTDYEFAKNTLNVMKKVGDKLNIARWEKIVELCERDTAKGILYRAIDEDVVIYCPTCGYEFFDNYDFCPNCGQKLRMR